jgi:hypothetical protein
MADAANCKTPHDIQAENGASDPKSHAGIIDRDRESFRSDLSSLQQDQDYYKQSRKCRKELKLPDEDYLIGGMPRSLQIFRASRSTISLWRGTDERLF